MNARTTSEAVANYFIDKAKESACTDLSQMKLQKLVYYAYAWYLGLTGDRLFAEPIQAWQYGPVIQSLYREFRNFGSRLITDKAKDIEYQDGQFREVVPSIDDLQHLKPFLDRIWEVYGKYTPIQIANLTHEADTPWHQVASHYHGNIPRGITIPDELIREHFSNERRGITR